MKLENTLRKSDIRLDDLVHQLEKSNFQLKKELTVERDLSESKNKFLAMASHELRTPISGILTSAILIEKYNTDNNQNIAKHANAIKSMVMYLSNTLEDFLALDKLESGKIQLEYTEFDCKSLLQEIFNETKSLLKEGQTIRYNCEKKSLNLYQDRKILHIIIINILNNAIKYSPKNSIINLSIHMDNYLTISIQDNGIGIPTRDQDQIFEKYFRASNANHIQGTGIGLNLIKANISHLGGTIEFDSKENEGSTFTVRIPKRVKE